jgi:hypothetical protein
MALLRLSLQEVRRRQGEHDWLVHDDPTSDAGRDRRVSTSPSPGDAQLRRRGEAVATPTHDEAARAAAH